ncbi:MAG: L-ribulose-5-phosphate 4-epimerase AraD [Verrucomicrobiae bacterium]|nr:L-ribulose-5-phosphate 4-epimerase AraD [Verrucomicrobiae bacterium]
MRYTLLKERVCRINQEIVKAGLARLTFGNASGAADGVMAIKPSGVDYAALTPDDIVILDIATGKILEGVKHPSSDTPTHRYLYRKFSGIGGIVHTHSLHATSWAQAGRPLPCYGTTHADHFHGAVPVTRALTQREIARDYEWNTGKVIVETCRQPHEIPAVLVSGHAPFVWGATPEKALENAIALEVVAQMALLHRPAKPIAQALLDKHFFRKHGPRASYGQR